MTTWFIAYLTHDKYWRLNTWTVDKCSQWPPMNISHRIRPQEASHRRRALLVGGPPVPATPLRASHISLIHGSAHYCWRGDTTSKIERSTLEFIFAETWAGESIQCMTEIRCEIRCGFDGWCCQFDTRTMQVAVGERMPTNSRWGINSLNDKASSLARLSICKRPCCCTFVSRGLLIVALGVNEATTDLWTSWNNRSCGHFLCEYRYLVAWDAGDHLGFALLKQVRPEKNLWKQAMNKPWFGCWVSRW